MLFANKKEKDTESVSLIKNWLLLNNLERQPLLLVKSVKDKRQTAFGFTMFIQAQEYFCLNFTSFFIR